MGRKTTSVRAIRQKHKPQQPVSSIEAVMATKPIQMRSKSLRMLLKKQKRGQQRKWKLRIKKLLRAYKLKRKKRKRQGYSHLPLMQMRCMTPGWILLRRF